MNKKYLIALVPILLVLIFYSLSNDGDAAYKKEIEDIRKEKVNFLCYNQASPFPNQVSENGFHFYGVDSDWKVKAELITDIQKGRVSIPTNKGELRDYILFAKAVVEYKGEKDTLNLYQEPVFNQEFKKIFIPFSDESNYEGSYPSGRYLDASLESDEYIILDFNLSYNPYCAYSEDFICPLPPKENHLRFAVEAGEKKYEIL